jgi:hypothetical protein
MFMTYVMTYDMFSNDMFYEHDMTWHEYDNDLDMTYDILWHDMTYDLWAEYLLFSSSRYDLWPWTYDTLSLSSFSLMTYSLSLLLDINGDVTSSLIWHDGQWPQLTITYDMVWRDMTWA